MGRFLAVCFLLMGALAIGSLFNAAFAQQETFKDQLTGTRTLVSNDNVTPEGTKRQLYGSSPKGILIFANERRFAQVQVSPARSKFKERTRLDGTPEENTAAIAGTVAHF